MQQPSSGTCPSLAWRSCVWLVFSSERCVLSLSAQSEERSSGVSDEQSSGKKRKRQATLSFGGCSSAPSAAVMSVLAEAEVPSTAVQELDIDEVVSEQLEAYKKASKKTLNGENAP